MFQSLDLTARPVLRVLVLSVWGRKILFEQFRDFFSFAGCVKGLKCTVACASECDGEATAFQ